MKQVTINLYSLNELTEVSKEKALIDHANFLMTIDPRNYERADIIDSIESNEYLFFIDGKLAPTLQYTGKHALAGHTVLSVGEAKYDITNC